MIAGRRRPSSHVRLALCGDVMLGRLVNQHIPRRGRGFDYPWGDVLPILRATDGFLINQEFCLTSRTEPWNPEGKVFHFRADPTMVEALKIANVKFSALANNHIGDFGDDGLLETIEILDQAGIAHAGAGRNAAEAGTPALLDINGLRVAIVAFADQLREWAAGLVKPGVNYTPISTEPESFGRVRSTIQNARDQADVVFFSIHWGPNMRTRPPEHFQEFARQVIDAGADLFWGHSAHVLQGIELHRGKPIIYDAGDFVDDYAVDPELRNDLTALFLVDVGHAGVEALRILPCAIDRMQVNRAAGAERAWIVETIRQRSAMFNTSIGPPYEEGAVAVQMC